MSGSRHKGSAPLRAFALSVALLIGALGLAPYAPAFASEEAKETLVLEDLLQAVLEANEPLKSAEARYRAAEHAAPAAGALPDPMLMVGYQNEGYSDYTYGEMSDAQWMFSASQMFPFWGKRGLKQEMVGREAAALRHAYEVKRFELMQRATELYMDLFLTYRNTELLESEIRLFERIERAALSRYSTGMAAQQDVLMVQSEKYMALERLEMLAQKRLAIEAALNSMLATEADVPLGKPAEPARTELTLSYTEFLARAEAHSPMLKEKRRMVEAAGAKLEMAEREYYPDVTLGASLFKRTGEFEDMWSLTATFNIPLYYAAKQREGVAEGAQSKRAAEQEEGATLRALHAEIRDAYTMAESSDRLMKIYKTALISKARQGFESAIAGYETGKVELMALIRNLTVLTEYEVSYWERFVEREKAVARLKAMTAHDIK